MGLCQCQVQICGVVACIALALALGDSPTIAKPLQYMRTVLVVVIHGKEFFVPECYPKDAFSRLEYDKQLIEEFDTKLTCVLHNMCKNNPPVTQPTPKYTKVDLIYKRVFWDFI